MTLRTFFENWITSLSEAHHLEGFVIYLLCSIIHTIVMIKHGEEFRRGMRGLNQEWDPSEISLYIFFWYSPHVITGTAFLDFHPIEPVWWFMAANLLFALLGREGLKQVLSLRFGSFVQSGGTILKEETKKEVILPPGEKISHEDGKKEPPVNI